MEPLVSVSLRKEIVAPFTSFQWSSGSDKLRTPERHIFKTSHGHDKYHLAAPGRTGSFPSRVMSVTRLSTEDNDRESKRSKKGASPVLGFLDEDKIGTIQPHDDVLEITLRIGGFDVKRVLVD